MLVGVIVKIKWDQGLAHSVCSKSVCTCFCYRESWCPMMGESLSPTLGMHTHTGAHTHYLVLLIFYFHSDTYAGQLLLEHSRGAIEMLTLSSLPNGLFWIPGQPGQEIWKIIQQVFLLRTGLSTPSILITLTFGPGHQLLFELCQQPSSWDPLLHFSLPHSFFFRPPEWFFSTNRKTRFLSFPCLEVLLWLPNI